MPPDARKLLARAMTNALCTRCGTCVGLSAGQVAFEEREGRHLPRIVGTLTEEMARRLWSGCSARDVPFPALQEFVFGKGASGDAYLGHAPLLAIGHATAEEVRRQGASGGLLTAILLWLLERGEIQGAVVTGMDPQAPWRPRTFIATQPSELRDAAQSKYVITSVNEILGEIQRFPGDLAYVGLPCQVHSLRKLQQAGDPAVRRVKWVLGPYCGNTLHFSSIRSLLAAYGVRDYREIASLRFRDGEWPGHLRIRLHSGRLLEMPKFHANYLIPFHIMKRCLWCTDLTNEFTDISGGDAWSPVYEARGKGFSLVLGRSERGIACLRDMAAAGRIELKALDADEAVRMHTHGFDLKKRGAFIRIGFRRWLGRDVPDYGYRWGGFPVARYLMEVVIVLLFALLGTRGARWCVAQLPPDRLGRLFVPLRHFWKRATRGIKTHELRS
jgi:coenzyme F420 hydrogenase subunit beta